VKQLAGRVALVTGGTRGLGWEMIRAFAEQGADVIITSRRQDACNVTAWAQCDRLVEASYERFGRVDILANDAGLSPLYPSVDAIDEAAIQAGPFLTDVSKAWDMDAFQKIADSSIALRRGGQPHEIVGATLYFASEASSFCTGAILRLDGGAS
jgi:NAD(P)-dependent dehydrogenase (short-subunit alcohol dehydrogenase family)